MKIKIDHIAKIEGHAGFVADIASGNVTKARLDIREGARLLEGILQGRSHNEVSQIAARICGVCPVVHTLASLKALEAAMGVSVSQQTILLRELLMMGQILNSHALHLFFFSLSDFFGFKDDFAAIKKYPAKAKDALLIRDFGNRIIEVIGGRSIHPLTPEVGGFKKLPDIKKLKELLLLADKALKLAIDFAQFFAKLKYPEFKRQCQFISLTSPHYYAIYDGPIAVDGKDALKIEDFMPQISESQVMDNPAIKRSEFGGAPYMVGALARINYSAKYLNLKAKAVLRLSGLNLPSANPFHNILAQAIEIVHCVEEAQKLLGQVIELSVPDIDLPFGGSSQWDPRLNVGQSRQRGGKGFSAIEAPRGTLFYYYEVGDDGLIKGANIITPTSQNIGRLEKDLEEYIPALTKKGKVVCGEKCEDQIKMLVRAYDPCLTCATH